MSQHPSLQSSDKDKKHRSVLKRYERIKILKEKEKWKADESVFGLQKVKIVKFKIKKEKAAAAEGTEAGADAGAATPAAASSASGGAAKAASQAKAPAAKEAPKAKGAPESKK